MKVEGKRMKGVEGKGVESYGDERDEGDVR